MATMVCDRREFKLNPNAPVFVPNAAYGEVEDFSSEWWDLVKTSPRFRDFWLSQHQEDDFTSSLDGDEEDLDFEFEELLTGETQCVESEEKTESSPSKGRASQPLNGIGMDAKALLKVLNVSKSPKGRTPKSPVGHSKYCEKKPAKPSSPRCTALRRIHQPR